jgi:hypothetical protein
VVLEYASCRIKVRTSSVDRVSESDQQERMQARSFSRLSIYSCGPALQKSNGALTTSCQLAFLTQLDGARSSRFDCTATVEHRATELYSVSIMYTYSLWICSALNTACHGNHNTEASDGVGFVSVLRLKH